MGKALSFFSDHTQIMNILTIFLIIVCFSTVVFGAAATTQIIADQDDGSNVTSWSNNTNIERYSEEKLKELRIEIVKFQILSKLNLTESPSTEEIMPSESSKETIEILLNEKEEHQRYNSIDREERLVIHARNNGVNCSQFHDTYCRMFQFEMSTTLNASSVDLWIHSMDENSDKLLSLSIFYLNETEERLTHRVFHNVQKSGWNKIELPRIFLPGSWSDHFNYFLEVSGAEIEYYGDRRLFLMVTKSSSLCVSRKRRDLTCDSNESCCLRPLRVSLSEIGFHWVLYPVHLDVNMCTGKCMMDHSKMKTHYERAMTKILENDSSFIESLGVCWTLCCKPKQLEAVRVIYNDSAGIIHDQYIPELTVKSCSCS